MTTEISGPIYGGKRLIIRRFLAVIKHAPCGAARAIQATPADERQPGQDEAGLLGVRLDEGAGRVAVVDRQQPFAEVSDEAGR